MAAFLEKMRYSLVNHEIKKIEKEIIRAYKKGDYFTAEQLTSKLMGIRNKQMAEDILKIEDFNIHIDPNSDLRSYVDFEMTDEEEKILKEALTSEPLSKEDDDEIKKILNEITNGNSKKM